MERLKTDDINAYAENLISSLDDIHCDCFPLKIELILTQHYNNPWITANLHKLISCKSH